MIFSAEIKKKVGTAGLVGFFLAEEDSNGQVKKLL